MVMESHASVQQTARRDRVRLSAAPYAVLRSVTLVEFTHVHFNRSRNNNNRELIERFRKLKALYNLTYSAQIPIITEISGMQAYKTNEN